MNHTPPEKPHTDVRRRAEALLKEKNLDTNLLDEDSVQDALHELHVHQIELELQNQELQRAYHELEAIRDQYADLYDFAPVGYVSLRRDGIIERTNLTFATMLGVERGRLVHRSLAHFVVEADQPGYYWYRRQLFDDSIAEGYELRLRRADDTWFYARLEGAAVTDATGTAARIRLAVSDITARKQAELEVQRYQNELEKLVQERTADLEREIAEHKRTEAALQDSNHRLETTLNELTETQNLLVQQERLAVVGQLAAGISHDFNNILTPILGYAEVLQLSPDTPEPIQSDLTYIIQSARRAAHLTKQLLDFSRKSIRQPRQLDLVTFLKESVKFLQHTIPKNIRIELEIDSTHHTINADATQIQQLLTNLAVNARDAMPSGGQLTIRLSRQVIEPEMQCLICQQPIAGTWETIEVIDTGTGISPDVQPHIFEPFFTTKKVGEGSGLGLSQVYGIVTQHEGHITVTSQGGQGTTFTVYLPPIAPTQNSLFSPNLPVAQPAQDKTILVIEDEPAVLEAVKTMVHSLGYRVIATTNGHEALDIYAARKDEIALVLSDVMMPGMDGLAVFSALQDQHPGVRVILMSGYPMEDQEPEILAQGAAGWLQKPMTLQKLAQALQCALSHELGLLKNQDRNQA